MVWWCVWLCSTTGTTRTNGSANWFDASRFNTPLMRAERAAPLHHERPTTFAGDFGNSNPYGTGGTFGAGCLHRVHPYCICSVAVVWFFEPKPG
jgi:hypothetical protein